ncbi:hypothetical protein MA16_Dca014591 [Dendrobium catenatum]|uniref:Uncharacterized protein n=1 Tax=Dendrobium catenatum TaxID=906689 RepID=A0A2I0XJR8_9ASPA|nr:hypothetical protein MA16_Dca014591 [Dendrobium catenatum]
MEEYYPAGVHPTHVLLIVDILKGLVVAAQDKILMEEIVFSLLQSSYDSVELLFICRPLLSRRTEFLTKKLDRFGFLGEYNANPY